MIDNAAIKLTGLTAKRGAFVLGPLDLTLERGMVVALIGPNGAGKTTTLDLIMGLGRPDSGRIEVGDLVQPRDQAQIKARIAYVSPDLNFAAWGKVGRALDFVSGFYPDWDKARCERLLAQFGLSRGERILTLSFGARIKLSLVMALSRRAEILLLDEPTVGLDVQARLALFAELLEAVRSNGASVVISSHQLADLERLADQVVIMAHGRILSAGGMDELTTRHIQIDAQLTTGGALPALNGVRLIAREGDRLRLLFDRDLASEDDLARAGLEILARSPMSLEEVFVALTAGQS
ncbi:MAG: transporter [Caulobacteraceae bacterium]|nr:transporter [Caulobacteraceae bacterium]